MLSDPQPISPSPQPSPITFSIPDKQTASRLVDFVVRRKPLGWGRKSFATYYKKIYADWLAKELEILIQDRQPKVFRLNGRYTLNTLYLLVNQSFMWLREETSGEEKVKWNKLWHEVKIEKCKSVGVMIQFLEAPADMPTGENFVDKKESKKWRSELDAYLNSDDIAPFHKDRLVLTNEEVAELRNELDGLDSIQFSVNNKEIKIIKVS